MTSEEVASAIESLEDELWKAKIRYHDKVRYIGIRRSIIQKACDHKWIKPTDFNHYCKFCGVFE